MGYFMDQRDTKFTIKKENFEAALKALKDLFRDERNMPIYDWINGTKHPHFSWVSTKEVLDSESLCQALSAIRWSPDVDSNEDINYITFEGEKSGNENIFFATIAPYVENGSYIGMEGEDGYLWRWVFNNGEVKETTPTIIWD